MMNDNRVPPTYGSQADSVAVGNVMPLPSPPIVRELLRRARGRQLLEDAIDSGFIMTMGARYSVEWTEMEPDFFSCPKATLYGVLPGLGVWLVVWGTGADHYRPVISKRELEDLLDSLLGPAF